MKLTKGKTLLILLYTAAVVTWTIGNFTRPSHGAIDLTTVLFLMFMNVIPLYGGFTGFLVAKKWGGVKSTFGRAVMMIALGLLTWGGGMTVWNIYLLVLKIDVPYPSWADGIFILSWPLWSIGVYFLSHVIGAKYGLKNTRGRILAMLVAVVVAFVSYYLLFMVARQNSFDASEGLLKAFFDLFYPVGTATIAIFVLATYTLSERFLGGRYKNAILLLFTGYVINYCADFIFSYTTTAKTYFNGHFVDLLFTTSMFVLSLAINKFAPEG